MHHEQKTNFCSYHFLFSAAQQTLDTTEMVQRGHIIQSTELRSGGLCCNKADVLQRQSMMGDTVADLSSGTSLLDVLVVSASMEDTSITTPLISSPTAATETTRQRCQDLMGICSVCTCTWVSFILHFDLTPIHHPFNDIKYFPLVLIVSCFVSAWCFLSWTAHLLQRALPCHHGGHSDWHQRRQLSTGEVTMATGGSLGAKAVLKRKMSHLLIRLGSAFQPFASSLPAFICKQNDSGSKRALDCVYHWSVSWWTIFSSLVLTVSYI